MTYLYCTGVWLITLILLAISYLLKMKLKYDREKYSTFECGFDLVGLLRLPFSLNFYLITIIFLIFDVELTLILPFVFNFKTLTFSSILVNLSMLFIILTVGFIYEWKMGLLNWMV